MEPTQELTLEESVAQVMQALPPVLRQFIADEKNISFAKDLAVRFNLTVDQLSLLTNKLTLLIMGIDTPDEFVQGLAEEGGLDEATVTGIAQAVNDEVFVPLQAQMSAAPAAPVPQRVVFNTEPRAAVPPAPAYMPPPAPLPKPPVPVTEPFDARSQASAVGPRPAAAHVGGPPPMKEKEGAPAFIPDYPMGTYAPPPQSPRYPGQEASNLNSYLRPAESEQRRPHLINRIPPQSRDINININIAHPASEPAATRPSISVNTKDARLFLEDHEEPHIDFNAIPKLVRSTPALKAAEVPMNLPGQSPQIAAAPSEVRPSPAIPKVEPPIPKLLEPDPAAPRAYSVDPYHEPIEGE